MWTKMGPHFGKAWLPNHFVPLITVSEHMESNNESATPPKNVNDVSSFEEISECKTNVNIESQSNVDSSSNVSDEGESHQNVANESNVSNEGESHQNISHESYVSNEGESHQNVSHESYVSNEGESHQNVSHESEPNHNVSNESELHNGPFQTLPNGKFIPVHDLMNLIHGHAPTVPNVPRGKKNNVFVLVNGEENIKANLAGKKASYFDDCGVWNGA
ncbi:hypothetical protein DPMN_156357 [Dreissena polymorpha]|uniref:Uncharacterized protein n=1 Tax=Dreissena polymorpha TaxID=45954 RepID=A0A9D4FT08_DREPO|nr:hypothetical protein DPMN_156357 [Dreissena polymorpha]